MLTATLLAAAVLTGAPWLLVGVLALGLWSPAFAAVGVVVAVIVTRSRNVIPPDAEATWCGAMAAELRAGSSLRFAIDAASSRVPELGLDTVARLARSGAPIAVVSDHIVTAMPRMRSLVGPALRIAAESGAAATGVFGRLAVRSIEDVDDERERRVATTQVRVSASVIAVLPIVVLAALIASGRTATLVAAGPIGVGALGVGVGLQACGVALVWVMSRRAAT